MNSSFCLVGLSSPTSVTNTVGQVFSVILVLFFTLALVYFFGYLAKRMKIGTSIHNNIDILEYKNIGHNNNLVIVKVGKKYMLLGSTREHVTFVSDLHEEDLNLEAKQSALKNFDFKEVLQQTFNKDKSDDKKE